MIHKYEDFLFDSVFESLLLESRVVFSEKFKSLLNVLPDNKVKNALLSLDSSGQDLNLVQNFFDVSKDSKEEITFIQDRRAQQIMGTEPMKFVTTNDVGSMYLTFNKKDDKYVNRVIFEALGFDPDSVTHDIPSADVVGDIIGETPSRKTPGKIFVLFKWGENNMCVLNKNCVIPYDDRYDRVWSLTRNPIRIGRAINALLSAANVSATSQEVEQFVNLYKSSWDIMNDAFLKFDVVKGDDIAYWYSNEHYEDRGKSTLGNSCMAEVDSDYFDLYVFNPDVCSLVILYSDNGRLENGKFKSNYIKGRALLWKTTSGDMFMDRIYYNYESDVDLFKQFAEKNDWWCKRSQDSDTVFTASLGQKNKQPSYTVKIRKAYHDHYPYVDTLCYINRDSGFISNDRYDMDEEMRSTGGGIEEI
jgi:hypothetical protein